MIVDDEQNINIERKGIQMLPVIKRCGFKGFILEPYNGLFKLLCNYTSVKPTPHELSLPTLPVPKLNDTLRKYLKSVKPFLSNSEFDNTLKIANEFAEEGGLGHKLQRLLEKRAESSQNWLEEWWLNNSYLENRNSLVVFSNPGSVLPFRKFNSRHDQLKLAAKTLLAALEYMELVENDKIPFDMVGNRPLDMSQYKKVFGTCRLPAMRRDKLSYNNTKYVIVIHNNHIFHVDLLGRDCKKLSEDQIMQALDKVMKMSETSTEDAIGILTSENRDRWAVAYQTLSKDTVNAASLRDVERSAAVLCLDRAAGLWAAAEGERRNLAAAHTIHGAGSRANGANRWFDKTIQFIIGADGITGLNFEHTPAEGQPVAVLTDYIVNYIDQNKTSRESSTEPIEPIRLQFNVNGEVKKMIQEASDNFDILANSLELNCFKFDKYGKDFIKYYKMSPDSYLQTAMQYAFYSVYKTPGAHYESAATRMFVGGRTETIRSCSQESVAFAQAMLDAKVAPKDKLASMRRAVKAHKDYAVQAQYGLGVDRHLMGLRMIANENGIDLPKLYTDPGYVRSAHMRISTSQVACKYDGFMCFGPLVADGYAVCYNPRATDINFALSALAADPSTSCSTYRNALECALLHMYNLLVQTTSAKL